MVTILTCYRSFGIKGTTRTSPTTPRYHQEQHKRTTKINAKQQQEINKKQQEQ
eukprot:m.37688 g.37688  ORF g.37688 m.37688 type:complete len:53 (-) comp11411_c0_seq1:24-182(-)